MSWAPESRQQKSIRQCTASRDEMLQLFKASGVSENPALLIGMEVAMRHTSYDLLDHSLMMQTRIEVHA